MDQIQKEVIQQNVIRPLEQENDQLSEMVEELQKLTQTLDPYSPLSLSEKEALNKFGITDHSDPFAITNSLLMLLENALEKLHQL